MGSHKHFHNPETVHPEEHLEMQNNRHKNSKESKGKIIHANTQEELDNVRKEGGGVMIRNGGSMEKPIIVRSTFSNLLLCGHTCAVIYGKSHVIAQGNCHVELHDYCTAGIEGNSHADVYDHAMAAVFDNSTADVYDSGDVMGYENTKIYVHGGEWFDGSAEAYYNCTIIRM